MYQVTATTTTPPVNVVCSIAITMTVEFMPTGVDLPALGQHDVHTTVELAASGQHGVALPP